MPKTTFTLSQEQIDLLFAFCRKHYVHHYDVQAELVDHLANAIEEKMAVNPQLSFEKALESIYAGFGIKGFADIVASRMRTMERYCIRQRWQYFLAYFTWPKVAMTTCALAAILLLGKWLPGQILAPFMMVLLVASYIYEIIVVRLKSG